MDIKYVSADEAVSLITSNSRVFIQGSAATPLALVNALLNRAGELDEVELVSISLLGDITWRKEAVINTFRLNSLFVSENVREWVNSSSGDYVPVFLSEIPGMFEKNILPLDTALVHVSPPDKHGYCSLGTSVDAAISAVRSAKKVIAQVNPKMPRTHGDGHVHVSAFAAMIWQEQSLPEINYAQKADSCAMKIGENVASLIENGSTLQMGIGSIPDAVLSYLSSHRGLGIHTEMFSDGLIPLIEAGVITNEHKKVKRGKTVTTFVLGTKKVYDFVDDNPAVAFMDVSFVNDTAVIRKNPKVVAINSAIEIDLTGQICADSIGTYQYSGIGGQMDYMRGAALSDGGKPIIALPSVTSKGISRIVPFLKTGAGVVTTRGHVHYVVTEHGIVNLYGKNMDQRARLLIGLAAPEHREDLEREYIKRFGGKLTTITGAM